MAMIIILLVVLVVIFKFKARYWKEIAELREKHRDEMYKHCIEQIEHYTSVFDKINKDWSNRYYTLKEYANRLETLLNLNEESEVEK